MQETEAKFYAQDLKKIETRIQELGARLIQPRVFEINIRFDQPDGRLRSEGQVLRLRQDTEARLTYKGRGVNENGIISRAEIEFTVEAFEKAKLFIEALGYQKTMEYDKYRTTYEFQTSDVFKDLGGLVHIMLDELPYGNFVEIEGEDMESIRAAAEILHLNMNKSVATSYLALFERIKQSLNLPFTDLTFDNFKGINISIDDLQVQPADV